MANEEIKPIKRTRRRLQIYNALFDGKTFQEIADLEGVGYNVHYLRTVLGPSGRWYPDYMLWANDKADIIERESRIRIRKRLSESLTVLEYALTQVKGDLRTAVKAANSLLDRGGLKAPEKIEVSNPYDQAERLAQWIEGKNKPKQTDE